MGPVVDQSQLDQDLSRIDIGVKEGAKLAFGGERLNRETEGFYLSPALFTETTSDMRINREEIFGPVASGDPGQGLRAGAGDGERHRVRPVRRHRHLEPEACQPFQAGQPGRHGDGEPADRGRGLSRAVRRPGGLQLRPARAGPLRRGVLHRGGRPPIRSRPERPLVRCYWCGRLGAVSALPVLTDYNVRCAPVLQTHHQPSSHQRISNTVSCGIEGKSGTSPVYEEVEARAADRVRARPGLDKRPSPGGAAPPDLSRKRERQNNRLSTIKDTSRNDRRARTCVRRLGLAVASAGRSGARADPDHHPRRPAAAWKPSCSRASVGHFEPRASPRSG